MVVEEATTTRLGCRLFASYKVTYLNLRSGQFAALVSAIMYVWRVRSEVLMQGRHYSMLRSNPCSIRSQTILECLLTLTNYSGGS